MGSLFDKVRSEQNLFSAWRHVKRSALNSDNLEIRGFAAEFEHQHQKHLRRFACQLREDRFQFDAAKGVLKDKKKRVADGKDPRPIAIATLKNRVVQRAILQVLQPRFTRDIRNTETRYETAVDPKLGKINEINRSKFGVGGLLFPYGGVRPAITRITSSINAGSRYFFQSDIRAFFTKIPTKNVVEFVRRETGDDQLSDLFAEGLKIELSNKDELETYAKLFPSGGIGVAQGSSLSAFAGNVLLFELDHELNSETVTSVRYIDDILMVSSSVDELDKAISHAKRRLDEFGFSLYEPVSGSDKAARGECSNSFNFLGCTIQPNRCVPSARSLDNLRTSVASTLSASKHAINETIHSKKEFNRKMAQSAVLQTLGKKIFGWQRSFSFCTDTLPFKQLDEYIIAQISDYEIFLLRKLAKIDSRTKMMILGIPSAEELHRLT